jgi:hypothetical protein
VGWKMELVLGGFSDNTGITLGLDNPFIPLRCRCFGWLGSACLITRITCEHVDLGGTE